MRKATIGAMGIITVIVLLCFTGCQGSDSTTQKEQPTLIHLRTGRKLVSCDWNSCSRDVMYLTRPMEADEKAIEYEYRNQEQTRLIIIKEEARRDMSGSGRMRAREASMRSFLEE